MPKRESNLPILALALVLLIGCAPIACTPPEKHTSRWRTPLHHQADFSITVDGNNSAVVTGNGNIIRRYSKDADDTTLTITCGPNGNITVNANNKDIYFDGDVLTINGKSQLNPCKK